MIKEYTKLGKPIDFEMIAEELPGKRVKTIKEFYQEEILRE